MAQALNEVSEQNDRSQRAASAFVAFGMFAADKRLLSTDIALENQAPLGALYESAKSLRSEVTSALLPTVSRQQKSDSWVT